MKNLDSTDVEDLLTDTEDIEEVDFETKPVQNNFNFLAFWFFIFFTILVVQLIPIGPETIRLVPSFVKTSLVTLIYYISFDKINKTQAT